MLMIKQQKMCNKITKRFGYLVRDEKKFETELAYCNHVQYIFIC